MGKPAKNSAKGLYEAEAQNSPFFIWKLERRELLGKIHFGIDDGKIVPEAERVQVNRNQKYVGHILS